MNLHETATAVIKRLKARYNWAMEYSDEMHRKVAEKCIRDMKRIYKYVRKHE